MSALRIFSTLVLGSALLLSVGRVVAQDDSSVVAEVGGVKVTMAELGRKSPPDSYPRTTSTIKRDQSAE